MPFIEITRDYSRSCASNPLLKGKISICSGHQIDIAEDLMTYFPSKTMKIFVDKENKIIGFRDDGKIKIGKATPLSKCYRINLNAFRDYKVKRGRYDAVWSKKHKMLIIHIEFDRVEDAKSSM